MKVLLFSHEFPPMVGGAGSYTYDLAMGLKKNGNEVSILAGKTKDKLGEKKIEIICDRENVKIKRYNWINKSRLWFLFWDKLLIKYLEESEPFDLLIFCNYTSNIIGSKVFMKIKLPYRIIVHGDDVDYFFKQERLKDFLMFRKGQMINYFQRAEAVISVSHYLQEILLENAPFLKNTKVVHNGISLEEFNLNKVRDSKKLFLTRLGFNGNEQIIFCAGRLVKGKGQDSLIKIFSDLSKKKKDIILIIAGDGVDFPRLNKIVKESGLEQEVKFVGALSRRDILTYYAYSDVFVLLSRLNETFGIVFIEAMSMGTPVIGTEIGGIPEVIENGVNGITVNLTNESEIKNLIIKVLTDDKFSDYLVSNGHNCVKERFNNRRMAEETIK